MLELARKINLSENLISKLELFLEEKAKEVERLAVRCETDSFSCLKGKGKMMNLAVILFLAVRVKEKYSEKGISDEIYYDTMGDIKIWCEKNGDEGLEKYGWLKNHVSFELFRIGRLQFQFYRCNNKTLKYKKLPFSYGEKLIYVHIPEGEKLEKERCIDSLRMADVFFADFFPEYSYSHYFCESWLLFERNRDFMSPCSNILSFMSLFDIRYSMNIDAQTIERVFGKRRIIVNRYPEKTELQRRLKSYIKSGHRPGIGVGVISRERVQNF